MPETRKYTYSRNGQTQRRAYFANESEYQAWDICNRCDADIGHLHEYTYSYQGCLGDSILATEWLCLDCIINTRSA